ncbi:MAG: tetratricopeptide repeat protein, partial [Verrucomicrobiota bacterium]
REVALQQYEQLLDLTRSGSWLNREIRSRIEQVYRAQDDVPGLVVYYNQWMEAHPKDIEAILLLSDALNEISRFKESVEWLEQAVSMAPDRVDIAYALAKALEKTDQYDRAVLVARNLTVKQPNDTRYWELLAELLLKRNLPVSEQDRQQALAALSEIAPEGSRDVSRILQLAEMLYARDFGEEAVVQFSRALALSPAASDIRLRQAEILMALEQQDQAYTLLEGLVAGDQAQPENYQRLASVWTRYGENERAYQAIAAGLEINAEYFDLLWLKWNLLTEEQRWSEALDLYPSLQKAVSSEYLLEQLEVRYLQVLHASGQSDQVWRDLNQRVADAGASGLSVPEFRVLLRMALQKQSALEEESFDALMKQAIEAHPESESLLRMALAQQRRDMRYDEAVATAYQLAKVNPKLKTDWLAQIARIRMQQGELEQALSEARKVIELSPAATEGYLLFANLAVEGGQWEQAEERLRQAIRLSDQPNQVRVKLGGMLQDAGELKKAQNVFNDAFTAADSARERLNLMRPLSEVYFQMGQIEELIRKMEQRQQAEGEGGGWRYGLYLAEIYQQLQDYGSARDQLAKSLSQRPDDIQLIQQLIALAERERNVREVIFYREKLLEHDPAVDHAIVLAQDYLSLSQQEDAWLLIQRFKKEFLQDPMAWEEVLGQLDEGKYKEPVRGLLQESMRVRPNALETELALAKYHVRRANYQVAEEALWNIYLRPVPAETEAEKKKRESEA